MLERITSPVQTAETGRVLKMVNNPRMGGGVPAWVKPDSAHDIITAKFAALGAQDRLDAALPYRMQEQSLGKNEKFGFYDLLDMVNPLQHIPLVNVAYRKITGDEIKGAPQIIGGALFGGAIGAAGGLANVIIQEETGKGFTGNALALASGEKISYRERHSLDDPQKRLADTLQGNVGQDNLPVSMLAFTNTGTRFNFANETRTTNHPVNFSPYEIY
jgi:hypothetical protein